MEKLVCVEDFEKEALQILDQNTLDYYRSGADDEVTLRENKRAFKRWIIRPRMLRDISKRDLSTEVLGKRVSFPVGISPSAMQKLAHEDGELANTRAAASMDTIYILSTIATSSIEEVAKANPKGRKWFQLYVFKDRSQSLNLVRRAELAGFEALVLTVDAPFFGKRRSNVRHKFHLPKHLRLANFEEGTGESSCLNAKNAGSALSMLDNLMDQSLTWKDVDWLRNNTKLPIIVKGVLTAEDATIAVQHGVAGVFVSNHGGRQLDTVLASADALPEVVRAVNGRCDVYLDGGVSSGTDVFKALALGAKMVFAGRPFLWGLAVAGEQGVKRVLEIFKEEFDLTMALTGVGGIGEINENYIARASQL